MPERKPSPEERAKFWEWVSETYRPQEVATLQQWSEAIWSSPYYYYWLAYDRPYRVEGLPRIGMPLTKREYEEGIVTTFRSFVDRGEMTEAQARTKIGEIDYWVNTYGFSPDIPYYDAVTTMRRRTEAQVGAPQIMPSGATMTAEGEYIPARGAEFPVGGGIRTTVGPLGFAGTRGIQPRGMPTVAQPLAGLPSGRGMMEETLGAASPAMQQYFMSQFPYLYEKFGGEEARIASQRAYQQRLGQAAYLGEKRAGAQWVLGKKLPYIRTGPGVPSPYIESYQATAAKVKRLGAAAERAMPAGEWQDPWARYLQQYPWLEKFIRIPPAQRGFFPSRFAPMTRWL